MGKNNNKRERQLNPQPFLSDNDSHAKRSKFKVPKPKSHHQSEKAEENEELISSTMSSKILKQALAQQKEIQDEANLQNPNSALLFAQEYVTPKGAAADDAQTDDDDIDGFDGFSETQSRFGADDVSHSLALLKLFFFKKFLWFCLVTENPWENTNFQEEIDEEDERVLEAFLAKDAAPQRTLADIIVEKLKQQDPITASGSQLFWFFSFWISEIASVASVV